MPLIDYLLIGHVTADLVANGRLLGGTVSYATPVARAFDNRVGLLTSAAAGESLIDPLISVAEVFSRVSHNTTTFSNIYESVRRTQIVHSTAAPLTYDMLPAGWLDAPLVHLAPLVGEVDMDIARRFPNSTVLLTPQGNLRHWDESGKVSFKKWFDLDVLATVDILIFSRQDIAEAPDLEFEFASACKNVIVTDGVKGGTYYQDNQPHPYKSFPVTEVEPTGAGDVFAASVLASLPRMGNNIQSAIRVAARLAAVSVTRSGAWHEFTSEEIQQALDYAQQDT